MTLELSYVRPGTGQDGRIIAPQVVLNKMNEIDGQVSLLQAVIADDANTGRIAEQPDGTAFIRAWAAFTGEWRLFFEENRDWLSRFTSGVVDQVEGFARRYNGFEDRLRAFELGIEPGTPTRDELSEGRGGSALLWAGVLVAGIFGVAWLTREGRRLYAETRGEFRLHPSSAQPAMQGLRRRRSRQGVAGLHQSLLPSLTR